MLEKIVRKKTKIIKIGNTKIGGTYPILIQSMVKTDTANVNAVIAQIKKLTENGCEIVRVSVKNEKQLNALPHIKKAIKIPLVADIHFNHIFALKAVENVDKIRINPSNIDPKYLKTIALEAKKNHIPIRIGINSGSVIKKYGKRNNLIKSMLEEANHTIRLFEGIKFYDTIVSLKASDVVQTVAAYKQFSHLHQYPVHLGVTATGVSYNGVVKSSIGIGSLLLDGIGDTVRVSLSSDPVEEVSVAKMILESLRLRKFGLEVISCPTCGRCQVSLQKIIKGLQKKIIENKLDKIPIKLAVMGCEVNGPGEASDADIGVACGKNNAVLFLKGHIIKRVPEKAIVNTLIFNIKKHFNKRGD